MRPYLAIIKDSFRAALASRVLYVLLGLITVLLLILAPIHIRETLDWQLKFGEQVRKPELLVRQLMENKDDAKRPELNRIWTRLSEKTRQSVAAIHEENDDSFTGRKRPPGEIVIEYWAMISDLNDIIKQPDFYQADDWEDRTLNAEAKGLVEDGVPTLSEERSRRLNRLLIANAFPGAIETGAPSAMTFYYGPFTKDWATFSITRQQVKSGVSVVLPSIFDKFILSIGLFIAILVTANIIPETFEPGSLNLLLSKPVSRWALYLTKFIGGCTLVALCSVYLFIGTWLWLGLGLGVWDRAFLWSIPLYILVFAIYFSVSALVGLTYRSAIMAIVITALFWGLCYGVGTAYGFLEVRMQNASLYAMTPVKDQIIAVDGIGSVIGWEENSRQWEPRFEKELAFEEQSAVTISVWMEKLQKGQFRLPPLYDSKNELVYAGQFSIGNPMAIDHQDFLVADASTLEFQQQGRFPRDAMAMFDADDGLLVVTGTGNFMRLDSSKLPAIKPNSSMKNSETSAEDDQPKNPEAVDENTETDLKSKDPPTVNVADFFKRIGPQDPVGVRNTSNVAFNHANQEVAICSRDNGKQRLYVYRLDGDKYQRHRSVELETGSTARMNCLVAYEGNTIVVAVGNGQVILLDGDSLKEEKGYLPESRFGIDAMQASKDGRWFALLYKNQKLWLLDTEDDSTIWQPRITGQGTISAIEFDEDSQLLVVDRTDRVSSYDLATMKKTRLLSPAGGLLANAYRYLVKPFYTVCPKPGEFYKVVTHLSDTSDTKENFDVDLTRTPQRADPFLPLWSGLGFMALMLLLACTIFHYKDF